jgi:PAS domain-containing protein
MMMVVGSFLVSQVLGDEMVQRQFGRQVLHALERLPVPVIAMDRELKLTYLNQAGADLFQVGQEAVQGRRCTDVYPASIVDETCRLCQDALEHDAARAGRVMLGDRVYCSIAAPLKEDDGTTTGVVYMLWEAGSGNESALAAGADSMEAYLTPRPSPDGSGHWVPVFIPESH